MFKWRTGRPDSAVARLWTANLAETARQDPLETAPQADRPSDQRPYSRHDPPLEATGRADADRSLDADFYHGLVAALDWR